MACYYYAHVYNAKAYGFSLWRIDLLLRECENLLLSQQILSPTQEVDTRGVSTLTEFPNAVGDTPKQCTLLILKDTSPLRLLRDSPMRVRDHPSGSEPCGHPTHAKPRRAHLPHKHLPKNSTSHNCYGNYTHKSLKRSLAGSLGLVQAKIVNKNKHILCENKQVSLPGG